MVAARFRHRPRLSGSALAFFVILFSVVLLLAGPALAGGVTIVTHGYVWAIGDEPEWLGRMVESMRDYPKGDRGRRYTVQVQDDLFQCGGNRVRIVGVGGPNPSVAPSGEIFIIVDWSQLSSAEFCSARKVAEAVYSQFSDPDFFPLLEGRPLFEQSIHLVGHSRGASLVTELAKLAGEDGVIIDHLTFLDPHPTVGDGHPTVHTNVLFADNYYQTSNVLDFPCLTGLPVAGAFNRRLNTLSGGYLCEHSDTHLWYHGTVDHVSVPLDDGGATITSSERELWYEGGNQGRDSGFVYSRLSGRGNRKNAHRPNSDSDVVSTGFARLFGGDSHYRKEVDTTAASWPNIVTLEVAPESEFARIGEPIEIELQVYDRDSDSEVHFYLDSDTNPYNSNDVHEFDGDSIYIASAPIRTTRAVSLDTSDVDPDAVGLGHHLRARITDGAHTRYFYARPEIVLAEQDTVVVVASAGSNGSISPMGSFAIPEGDSVTFVATPDPGYEVSRWMVDNVEVAAAHDTRAIELANVVEPKTVVVVFSQVPLGESQLAVDRPATDPFHTGDSSVQFVGTAPPGSTRVAWQNSAGPYSGEDGSLEDGTWSDRIRVREGSNTIQIQAYSSAGEVLATTSRTVVVSSELDDQMLSAQSSAFISSAKPGRNYGSGIVYVGYDPGDTHNERGLVEFSWDPAPGTTVVGAELTAKIVGAEPAGGQDLEITAKRITGSWSSGSVTWNSRPASTNAGASSESVPASPGNSQTWDVTQMVQDWMGTGAQELGFYLISQSENAGFQFERSFDDNDFDLIVRFAKETDPPVVQILEPSASDALLVVNDAVNVGGTAYDTIGAVKEVEVENVTSGGRWIAQGTENWLATVNLLPGPNSVVATAFDLAGNSASDTIVVNRLSAPANVSAVRVDPTTVLVEWDAVSAATHYRVYRSAAGGAIGQPIGPWLPGLSFTDHGLDPHRSYRYWVASAADSVGSVQTDVGEPVAVRELPPSLQLVAEPPSIFVGECAELSWVAASVTTCSASGESSSWSGDLSLVGRQVVCPLAETDFGIDCDGVGGPISHAATVSVSPPPAPEVVFSAEPASIVAGEPVELSWEAKYADSCSVSWPGGSLDGAPFGSLVLFPQDDTEYSIACTGLSGSTGSEAGVSVSPPPPDVEFGAAESVIFPGGSTELSWSAPDAISCEANSPTDANWSGDVAVSGTQGVSPEATTEYHLSCTGVGGTTHASPVTVVFGGYPRALCVGDESATSASACDEVHATIGAAMSSAMPRRGDTVRVFPGEYSETVEISEATSLVSVGGWPAARILGLDPEGPAIVSMADRSSVQGFSVGSDGQAGVRVLAGAEASIRNNLLHGTPTGVHIESAAIATLENNTLLDHDDFGIWSAEGTPIEVLRANLIRSAGTGVSASVSSGPAIVSHGHNLLFQNQVDYVGAEGAPTDVLADPLLVDRANLNAHLTMYSPARDAGPPDPSFDDRDGSRNDIGADGGPGGLQDLLAPVAICSAEPEVWSVPFTVNFDGRLSHDEWGIFLYCWDVDSADGSGSCDLMGEAVSHSYPSRGPRAATLTVTDNSGLTSVCTMPDIRDDPSPYPAGSGRFEIREFFKVTGGCGRVKRFEEAELIVHPDGAWELDLPTGTLSGAMEAADKRGLRWDLEMDPLSAEQYAAALEGLASDSCGEPIGLHDVDLRKFQVKFKRDLSAVFLRLKATGEAGPNASPSKAKHRIRGKGVYSASP